MGKVTITRDLLDVRSRYLTKIYASFDRPIARGKKDFQTQSPVGATKELKQGWSVKETRLVSGEFVGAIENSATDADQRIVGSEPGTLPDEAQFHAWAQAVGLPQGAEYRARLNIQRQGTVRWRSADNWVGLRRDFDGGEVDDNDLIPGGRIEQIKEEIIDGLNRIV
jgi:hypothetical protein